MENLGRNFDISNEKELVFWGASQWVTRIIGETRIRPVEIWDTNPSNNGVKFEGFTVTAPPEELFSTANDTF